MLTRSVFFILVVISNNRNQSKMSYRLLVLLLGSLTLILAETPSAFDRVKESLENSAQQLPIKTFEKLPDASSYLNDDLTNNNPHIINVNEQLTSIIREWNPRLLVLDPTSPYYFSKFNNISEPEHDRNLLSYLQASKFFFETKNQYN